MAGCGMYAPGRLAGQVQGLRAMYGMVLDSHFVFTALSVGVNGKSRTSDRQLYLKHRENIARLRKSGNEN